MPRPRQERPSKVLCTRAPADLWEPIVRAAKAEGETVSSLLRAGLRAKLQAPQGKYQAFAAIELVKAASQGADLAEVAGLLAQNATKTEERYIEKTAVQLQELVSSAPKRAQAKPKKAPKPKAEKKPKAKPKPKAKKALKAKPEKKPKAPKKPKAEKKPKKPKAPKRKAEKKPEGLALQGATCTVKAALTIGGAVGGIEHIPARYCLVEVEQLKTSHQPLKNFSATPGYPPDAQERDYRETQEQLKVLDIARQYAPELIFNTSPGAIDGVPVVSEERLVLGGNGRTMATQIVYSEGREQPKEYIQEHARAFGFSAAQVKQYKHPMVVRTIRAGSDPRELARWSRRLNQSLSQQLSPTLIAVSRAKFLRPSALEELAQLPDEETLAAWLSTTKSLGFVRSLQASGVIDARSAPAFLLASGLLSPEGRDLVNDLLVAVLVPDGELIKALGPAQVNTLAKAAPYLAQLKTLGRYDILPQFTLALRDRVTMQAQRFIDVRSYLAQSGMFGGGALVAGSAIAELWLKILTALGESPAKLAKLARRYVALAKGPAAGQFALLQEEHLDPYEALVRAAKEFGVTP